MFKYSLLNHAVQIHIHDDQMCDLFLHIGELVPNIQKGVINIAFLEDDEIRVLNNQYREKDQSTDVLSFHYLDDFSLAQEDEVVGEIILSESHILRQASDHQHSAEKEFLILVLHGILHILGYDHETDGDYILMWEFESKLRERIKI